MTRDDAETALATIHGDGFERSRLSEPDEPDDAGGYSVHVLCWGCDALVINGMACHETGCPERVRARAGFDPDDFDDLHEMYDEDAVTT